MRIEVTSVGFPMSEALRAYAARQVLLTMSRFGPRLRSVTLRLAETQNPLGGVDRRCRMQADVRAMGSREAEAGNGTMETAVRRAAARLAEHLTSELGEEARPCGPTLRSEVSVRPRPPRGRTKAQAGGARVSSVPRRRRSP
jgi:putative sigma-54 modulation protein